MLCLMLVPGYGLTFLWWLATLGTTAAQRELKSLLRKLPSIETTVAKAVQACQSLDQFVDDWVNFLCFQWGQLGNGLGDHLRFQQCHFARCRGLTRSGHEVLTSLGIFMSEGKYREMLAKQVNATRRESQ